MSLLFYVDYIYLKVQADIKNLVFVLIFRF